MQEEQEGMPDTLDESWDVDSSLDGWMLLRDTRGQTECVTTAFSFAKAPSSALQLYPCCSYCCGCLTTCVCACLHLVCLCLSEVCLICLSASSACLNRMPSLSVMQLRAPCTAPDAPPPPY